MRSLLGRPAHVVNAKRPNFNPGHLLRRHQQHRFPSQLSIDIISSLISSGAIHFPIWSRNLLPPYTSPQRSSKGIQRPGPNKCLRPLGRGVCACKCALHPPKTLQSWWFPNPWRRRWAEKGPAACRHFPDPWEETCLLLSTSPWSVLFPGGCDAHNGNTGVNWFYFIHFYYEYHGWNPAAIQEPKRAATESGGIRGSRLVPVL